MAGTFPSYEQITWLPDGKSLLLKNKAGRLYIVSVEANDEQRLQATDYETLWFAFSSATGAIALSETSPTSVLQTEIYDLENGELLARILRLGTGAWSPDGRFLAGGQSNERENWVAVIDMENPTAEPVEALRVRGARHYYFEGWSSRSDWLTITKETETGIKIIVVSWPSREVTPLYEFEGCHENSSWSPVSSEIAYQGNPNDNWDIFVEVPGTNNVRNLTNSAEINEYQPAWSPDGRYIAYVGVTSFPATESFQQDLYVVDVESGTTLQITDTEEEYESLPQWSPSGEEIAYLSEFDGQLYLYTIQPSGENRTPIVAVPPE